MDSQLKGEDLEDMLRCSKGRLQSIRLIRISFPKDQTVEIGGRPVQLRRHL